MVDGGPLAVDTRKAVALLAVLAVEGRRSREQLAALLWPESDEQRARGALRRTLSVLSSGLGPGWLHADRQCVELDDAAEVDLRRAHELALAVGAHNHPRDTTCQPCRAALDELVLLHRGTFLSGFTLRDAAEFDTWRAEEVERCRRQLVTALDQRSRLELADRDLAAALATLRRWRDVEPLNELVHRRLIRVHGLRGERLEAVHVYRQCVAVLERELGVAPLDVTTRLYQAVLDGEVDAAPATAPVTAAAPARPPTARAVRELPFAGRDEELALAVTTLRTPGATLVVEGDPGLGKTRFVEELEAGLHRDGTSVLAARCLPDGAPRSFGPLVELLRDELRRPHAADVIGSLPTEVQHDLARLLPERAAAGAAVPPAATDDARRHLLASIATALHHLGGTGTPDVVLIVEDVHLADAGTLDVLALCAADPRWSSLRLVCTRRPTTPPLGPDGTVLRLRRLPDDVVGELCRHALGTTADDDVVARLTREADGLPLAVVQYVEWIVRDGGGDPTAPWPLPAGLREVVEERLTGLDETTTQVASALALLGHGIDLPLLVQVSGRSEDEAVEALDDLLGRGVVVASRDGTFEFAHERLRSVAADACSPARRRLLHARIVTALATRAGRRGGGRLAARIAAHAAAAGLQQEAARWSVAAGDQAMAVFANDDALAHFERALALEPDDPSAIHSRIGRVHVLAGDYESALAAYEVAAALAADETGLTVVEHELGALHVRRREWAAARLHLEAALAGSHTTDPGRAARIRADVGLAALQRGDVAEAEVQARAALEAAESVEDREALAQARNLAGMVARRTGAVGEAQRHLEHAAALAAHLRDPSAYIAALNNLALTTAEAGEPTRATQLLDMALERCERQGDRHRQAALLNNLADLHHRAGDEGAAREHLVRAVALFSEVGGHAGGAEERTPDPEIWKLVEW